MLPQESPLKISMDRIDQIASVKGLQIAPPQGILQRETRAISAQRSSQLTKSKLMLNNGFLTPLKSGQQLYSSNNSGSKTKLKVIGSQSIACYTDASIPSSSNRQKSNDNQIRKSIGDSRYQQLTEMSPGKRGVVSNTQSLLLHTSISGIHAKHTENSVDRTQITKLGLKLQPICQKYGHERSKISYVCTDLQCNNEQKFGCAHCFLDEHAEHAMRKMRMDEFVKNIEYKHEQYIESVGNLTNLAGVLMKPTFLTDILMLLDRTKDTFTQKIDQMKEGIEQHIRNEIYPDTEIVAKEVQKQEEIIYSLRMAMTKNLFEMTDQEFFNTLNLHHEVFLSDLMKRTKAIQDRYNDLELKYTQSFMSAFTTLQNQLNQTLQTYTDFDVLLEEPAREQPIQEEQIEELKVRTSYSSNKTSFKNRDAIQRNTTEVSSSQNKSQVSIREEKEKRPSMNRENRANQSEHEQEINNLPETREQRRSSVQSTNSEKKLRELQVKKDHSEKKLRQNIKLIEELQTIQRDINYLSIRNHFPYTLYDECCGHTVKCNTVPIFECCKQAYRCTICHDSSTNHKHTLTNPSKRYCLKCFKIFNVKFFTNIAINCKECLSLKLKN